MSDLNLVQEEIKNDIVKILTEKGISNIDNFKEEIDSITFIEAIIDIETKFNITFKTEELLLKDYSSIDDIYNNLIKLLEESNNKKDVINV
ncbi:MAG: phosphopantetheine-binding protein [Bacilli bacterium]|jgi:acyl carrier protein|nr:phosphopantetheine-binding protein [Bacilli bacterium]